MTTMKSTVTRTFENFTQIDISEPDAIQIGWDELRRVLYVHVDGHTVLRVQRIKELDLVGLEKIHSQKTYFHAIKESNK